MQDNGLESQGETPAQVAVPEAVPQDQSGDTAAGAATAEEPQVAVSDAAALAAAAQDVRQMPAYQNLLQQLLDRQKPEDQKFFLVVLPEDALPTVAVYETSEELLEAIRGYLDSEIAVFPFLGYYMPVSKGPHRYLQTPFNQLLPLFTVPDPADVEFDPHGWLGAAADTLVAPTMPSAAMDAGEFVSAEDEEGADTDETPLWVDS